VESKKELMSKLNDDEKNDLVSLEIELVQAEVEQLKKAGDKDIDDIKTLMEEVDMRIAETKKDTYEFKRDIIIGAENPRSGKIAGEKMIRWVVGWR
jgi:predicted DNA-binding helix-hairpin-helix protein